MQHAQQQSPAWKISLYKSKICAEAHILDRYFGTNIAHKRQVELGTFVKNEQNILAAPCLHVFRPASYRLEPLRGFVPKDTFNEDDIPIRVFIPWFFERIDRIIKKTAVYKSFFVEHGRHELIENKAEIKTELTIAVSNRDDSHVAHHA